MRVALTAVAGFLVSGLVIGSAAPIAAARQRESRTIFVTALDGDGRPVTDLQAADFVVKLGNKPLEIVRAEPAQMPLRIAVIVADAGTGGFQQALGNFMQKLLGNAEFSLISVIVQPDVIVDYASEGAVLRDGLRRLGPRGRQVGAQLMEAIRDSAGTVRHDGRRPMILVLRVGSEANTPLSGDEVREQVRRSGALLHVVSTLGAQRRPASSARQGISAEQAQMEDNDTASSILNLGQVLGDGAQRIGRPSRPGGVDHARAGARARRRRAAAPVLRSPRVLPPGAKASDKLSVSATRKGVKLQAPVAAQAVQRRRAGVACPRAKTFDDRRMFDYHGFEWSSCTAVQARDFRAARRRCRPGLQTRAPNGHRGAPT